MPKVEPYSPSDKEKDSSEAIKLKKCCFEVKVQRESESMAKLPNKLQTCEGKCVKVIQIICRNVKDVCQGKA